MRRRGGWGLVLLGLLPAALPAAPAVTDLGWLSGCWVVDQGEAGTGEHWGVAAGGTLFGISRTVRQGRTAGFEFMQIRADGQGRLQFIAQPNGEPPTPFALQSLEPRRVVFEREADDFPQRVIYERPEPQRLIGRIEGEREGRVQAFDYPMSRVDCEPSRAATPR